MAKTVYRASVRGARRLGGKLDSAARGIQTILLDEFAGTLAPSLTRIARNFAPHDKGGLERGLKAKVSSRGGRIRVELESTARSEEGFPYTRATRFGRKAIRPRRARVLAWRGRDGKMVFTRFVRAWKPDGDWVQKAEGSWERELDEAQARIGRKIDTRLLR